MGIFSRIKSLFGSNNEDETYGQVSQIELKKGDKLSILGETYEIEGSITYDDSGYTWIEYKTKKMGKVYWICFENNEQQEISIFEKITTITKKAQQELEYNGEKYYLQEGSDARVQRATGNVDVKRGEEMDYYDYANSAGNKFLGIEIWDDEVEMSIGREVSPYQIQIYPLNR